jgi:NAD(P)-dependent dehydrogenase (short-subunit alcohol dehydrogenase family)
MDLGLSGKVAVITGPAKGMGRAISLAFADAGAKLVLAGRDLDAVAPVTDDIRNRGRDAIQVACDVTDERACRALAAAAMETFGTIDVLVNVAGGSGPIGKTGVETSMAEFDDIVRLNLTGCFNTMRAVLPAMIAQRSGKIVNVGGTFGMRGRAGRAAYSASKWGLRGITKSFALEVGVHNINVNCVAPGMVDGPRFRDKVCADLARRHGISLEDAMRRHAEDYALKRVSTDVDVANACLFLASDVSRQITGTDLPVDGGWAML